MGNFIQSKRFFKLIAILWAVLLVVVLLFLYPENRLSPWIEQQYSVPVQNVLPSGHGPYSYFVSMGTERLSQTETFASPAVLLEDGRALGPGNAWHVDVGTLGGGRFSFWKGGHLIFSSSDNSDPRTNGRQYILVLPRSIVPRWLGWVLLLMLLAVGWFIWRTIRLLKDQTIRCSSWQLLGAVIFGLAVALSYLFHFLQNDMLDNLASTMILLHLWILIGVLAYWLLGKFIQIRNSGYTPSDLVHGARKLALHYSPINHPTFYLCALILILIFLITRLPFFIHYPIVGIAPDSVSYLDIISWIKLGRLPLFEARPPGYPLFIWLITKNIDRWMVVAGAQSLLFLTASLCLIYGVYSLRRSLSLPATLAMAGFLGSSQVLIYETYALSENLYTTCLIFIIAFLLLGFGRSQARYFIMSSVSMGILISIRPAGLYVLVVYAVILLYMFWNKDKPRFILCFIFPLLLFLFFWSAYNYFTLGKFGLSANSAYNMGAATAWFWEPDQSFPPAVNDVLSELPSDIKAIGVTDADQNILIGSWDPNQLFPIFDKLYRPLVGNGWTHTRFVDIISGESADSIVRTVMITAIKKHPDLYAKFVWTNLYVFFKTIEVGKWDFYSNLTTRVVAFYSDWEGGFHPQDHTLSNLYHYPDPDGNISKEYSNIYHLDFASVSVSGETAVVTLVNTPLKRLHMALQPIQWVLFHQIFWVIAFFIVLGVSTLKLLISKGKHLGAFILFVMAITVIGASLITCLSEIALERYAYPTQFIYYLSVALLPLLWLKKENKTHNQGL